MLEVFLLMLSSMVQTGAAVASPPPAASEVAEVAPPQTEVPDESVIESRPPGLTILGAPQPDPEVLPEAAPEEPAAESAQKAAPQIAFLAPKNETSDKAETVAPPAFLGSKAAEPQSGLVAEPQVPSGRFLTALEVRPILNATRGNWIAVREYGGEDLLYVTHLWSWRCGLAELRIGLNGAPPEIWPLPPCHEDLPMAATILESDGLPYRTFPLRSVQLIEVQLTYDDLSTARVRFNRGGVVIP